MYMIDVLINYSKVHCYVPISSIFALAFGVWFSTALLHTTHGVIMKTLSCVNVALMRVYSVVSSVCCARGEGSSRVGRFRFCIALFISDGSQHSLYAKLLRYILVCCCCWWIREPRTNTGATNLLILKFPETLQSGLEKKRGMLEVISEGQLGLEQRLRRLAFHPLITAWA